MIFRFLAKIERTCATLQGKGWGAGTVKEEVYSASKFIPHAKLAVDIGSNVGSYAVELEKAFKGIEVHLFEPSGVNYKILSEKFKDNKEFTINNKAVSDNVGFATLYFDKPGSGLASLTKRPFLGFDDQEKVETIAFENYWKQELNRRPIDILKIDVEGHEMDVLRGMGESIFKTKLIQFEFGGCNIDTKTYFLDFWNFFAEHHYEIYRITPLGLQRILFYSPKDDFFATTNFLCVNTSFIAADI